LCVILGPERDVDDGKPSHGRPRRDRDGCTHPRTSGRGRPRAPPPSDVRLVHLETIELLKASASQLIKHITGKSPYEENLAAVTAAGSLMGGMKGA
jgi:hypothetical protein